LIVNKLENIMEIPSLKSLYIEMYFNNIKLSSGTASLIAKDKNTRCVLMTNRHNITGRHQETGECLDKNAAIPNIIHIYFHKSNVIGEHKWKIVKLPLYRETREPYWIEHPLLKEKADIVALNLNWGTDIKQVPYYLDLGLDRNNLFLTPAETVSVIGYPFGLSSFGKFPIWATGFIAQELELISKENPIFLIDCRSRQGQSGSPVIAYRTNGYRKKDGDKISAVLSANTCWEFLGIYSGRINSESDLGKVWHVTAIIELYNESLEDYNNRYIKKDKN
jgi:hypothetical protein